MNDRSARPLLPAGRRSHILDALARDGIVRISQLSADLNVSPVTLRRDLAQFETEGLLQRVHGGAIPAESTPTTESAPQDGVTPMIAVVVPSLDYYWPGVIRGMESEAERHGMRLLLRGASYEFLDERPVLERLLRNEGAKGLVFAPNMDSPYTADVLAYLSRQELPVVLVERDAMRPDTHATFESVTTDHALGGQLAAHHLAQLGHRRVGLIVSRRSPTSRKIAAGWERACEEQQLDRSEHFERFISDHRSADFPATITAIIDTVISSGTTALLVHSDPEAITVVEYALARGLSVPGDLSVIAYDDEVARLYNPALTAVSPARAAVGKAAVDLLMGRIAEPDRPAQRVVVSPSLNIRETTAPAPH
ncbi:MAG TPA: substrate-binding domain-containing protein [Arachnia sp.]|nr:substrate-binding domain-containing protein [Arachnia sp.]HMT86763.1 substrate-binding domain-containing protein [Arachnia sp.]